jgi:hypothetical protein
MRAIACLPLALFLFFSSAQAAERKEDPFLVTAACDDAKSRVATIRLLAYVDRIFREYSRVKPTLDSVTTDSDYEGGPKIEMHEAVFGTFRASFQIGNDGKRVLWGLTTRSKKFPLPFGVEIGQTMAQVQRHLGPPTALSSDTILYSTGGEAISDVFFRFEGNKLAEVNWNHGMAD